MPGGRHRLSLMRLGPEKNIERVKESSKHGTLLAAATAIFFFTEMLMSASSL